MQRVLRCQEDEIVIRTPDIRIPANCKTFLSKDKNKERMVELIEKVWLESWNELSGASLYVARASSWIKIENGIATNVPELENDQEEADSKIAFIIKHATRENSECTVGMVLSSSGDIIIIPATHVYWLAMGQENTARSQTWVTANCQENTKKHCLGCIYWQLLCFKPSSQREATLLEARQREFSSSWLIRYFRIWSMYNITSDQLVRLEHFVCTIFGRRQNEARKEIFTEELEKDRKVIDLCLLPP